jgi:hypothetical protein
MGQLSKLAEWIAATVAETLAYEVSGCPLAADPRIRTNNPLDRPLREVRCPTRLSLLPGRQSALNFTSHCRLRMADAALSRHRVAEGGKPNQAVHDAGDAPIRSLWFTMTIVAIPIPPPSLVERARGSDGGSGLPTFASYLRTANHSTEL